MKYSDSDSDSDSESGTLRSYLPGSSSVISEEKKFPVIRIGCLILEVAAGTLFFLAILPLNLRVAGSYGPGLG